MNNNKLYLELERPIAFYPQLARVLGGINEALFVQQLYYWSDKGNRSDGFIYKTKTDIENETCLTARQQDSIVKSLKLKGLLEVKLLKAINGSPTLHYRLCIPLLQNVIMESNKMSESNITKSKKPVTESTTKTTADIISERSPQEIPEIIKAFESINPACSRYYGNKTQREACQRLIDIHTFERVIRIIQTVLPKSNGLAYVPTITTPLQLLEKYPALEAALKRQHSSQKKESPSFTMVNGVPIKN